MKLFHYAAIALLLLSGHALPAYAEEGKERPKIGLALSGGGARGGAHIGVLKALEELNVPVDFIAGTSMGAIVGGFYAAGYSADEIERLMKETDWNAALKDQPARRNRTMRKKELDSEFLIPFRVGFNNGKFQLPLGVVEGQHLDQIFHRILMPVRNIEDFDRLHIPFRAVATDLVTGDEVILSGGSLPNALRASMSVPGVFAPVRLGGRILVDGGMANNLPISVVREMGADVVIAVDISSPLLTEEELESVLSVSEQISNFLTRKNTEAQIATLGPDDILLVPDLGEFSSVDFAGAYKIAENGHEAVMAKRDEFAVRSVAPGAPALEPALWAGQPQKEYLVQFIEIRNDSVLNDEIIRSRLKVELQQPLDIDRLEHNIDEIYSLDVFESVTYDLVSNHEGETGLRISAAARTWGPNFLQFGVEFSDDFSGNSDYKLGVAYTRNALNSLGGELRIKAAIGREQELEFDFYQPIDEQARWFVDPTLFWTRQHTNVYEGDQKIAELAFSGLGARLSLGRNFSTTNQLRLQYQLLRGDADIIQGDPDLLADDSFDIGELLLEWRHDSVDSLWFPTTGVLNRLGYRYAAEALGASIDYEQVLAAGSFAFTRGRNTAVFHYEGGYSFDDAAPVERWFELGGFGRLSGLTPDQLAGRQMGLATLAFYRRLNTIDLVPAYAGITLEAGNVWQFADDISFSDLRTSGSVFVGMETFIGPLYFAWGYSDTGESSAYFYLGNPFGFTQF